MDEIDKIVMDSIREVKKRCDGCKYWDGTHCSREVKDGCVKQDYWSKDNV